MVTHQINGPLFHMYLLLMCYCILVDFIVHIYRTSDVCVFVENDKISRVGLLCDTILFKYMNNTIVEQVQCL